MSNSMMSVGEVFGKGLTPTECQDSETPSTEYRTTANGDLRLLSSDPRFAGLPDTPAPVICDYCGAERYTEGFNLFGHRMWFPGGAKPCTCPEGKAEHERKLAKEEARRRAEEKEKSDRKMCDRVRRIIGESGMGERFLQRTFQTFVSETTEQKKIKNVAQSYVRVFDTHLPKRGEPLPGRNGFLISGTKGTGKTHIAAAIANDLMSRGTAVICVTERNLFGRIKRTFSQGEHADESVVRGIYERVPLLIIDDLGKEKATEWTLATLYAIIDGRYDRAMPLIITTNYDAKSLVGKLTPSGADKTTADAIVDRLTEMCESIVMNGDSWRAR